MLRKSLAFVLAAVLLCAFAGVGAGAVTPQKEIAVIYFSHSNAWLQPLYEYKIDLEQQEFYGYAGRKDGVFVARDETAENEGYDYVRSLDAGKIERFRRRAALSGYQKWHNEYFKIFLLDGFRWDIVTTYTDGTETISGGWNALPPFGWDSMHYALKCLTGEDVLERIGFVGWAMNFISFILIEIIGWPLKNL